MFHNEKVIGKSANKKCKYVPVISNKPEKEHLHFIN